MTGGASVALRPATDADRPFLAALYATTRDDLAALPLPPEQLEALLHQQFAARSSQHAARHPHASSAIIEVEGAPAGRLVVASAPDEIRIVDIALLPPHRRRGIATQVLRPVLAQADERGVAVVLHVDPASPARRLYARLGFASADDDAGAHLLMVRPPGTATRQPKTA